MLDLYEPVPRESICMLTQVHTYVAYNQRGLHSKASCTPALVSLNSDRVSSGCLLQSTWSKQANNRLLQTVFIRGIRTCSRDKRKRVPKANPSILRVEISCIDYAVGAWNWIVAGISVAADASQADASPARGDEWTSYCGFLKFLVVSGSHCAGFNYGTMAVENYSSPAC